MSAGQPGTGDDVPWQVVFDQAAGAMAVLDLDGRYLHVNQAMCRLLGYAPEHLRELGSADITHPEDVALDGAAMADLLTGRQDGTVLEKRYLRSDGSVIWVLLSSSVIRDGENRPRYVLSQFQDITDRRESELLWHRSFANAPIGMALLDLEGRWTAVNDSLCGLLGYTRDEMLAMSFSDVTYAGDEEHGLMRLADLITGERDTVSLEKRYRHRDGHPIWMLIRSSVVPGPDGRPGFLVSQYEEIGERKMVDAHLAHLALHDPLTGLANRALLADRLSHALAQLGRGEGVVAVLLADLDRLKPVNDQYGHAAGDQVLIASARRLVDAVRSADTVARLGGDEFVVVSVLPDYLAADDLRVRIADRLRGEISVAGCDVTLRASVGLAVTKDPTTPPEGLLHSADQDMYARKKRYRATGDRR